MWKSWCLYHNEYPDNSCATAALAFFWVWQVVRCLSARHCCTQDCRSLIVLLLTCLISEGFWIVWMCTALNTKPQSLESIAITVIIIPYLSFLRSHFKVKSNSQWTSGPYWYVHTVWVWHSAWHLWDVTLNTFWLHIIVYLTFVHQIYGYLSHNVSVQTAPPQHASTLTTLPFSM